MKLLAPFNTRGICHDYIYYFFPSLQYVNKISEKLLGYKTSEMLGKNIGEIVYYENFVLMEQQISKGREFEGNMNCRRQNNRMLVINCRVIPFSTMLK